ncbi:hypothetical protein [Sphaerisporangium fuscum]|uniref:hypothetical protein n=1 Tax=Sphaerisporangium fuscum TaxID=2835868 RepID=UPI001BDCF3D2|nr:hypothetical protein [Sphaerisporangium fuscum]
MSESNPPVNDATTRIPRPASPGDQPYPPGPTASPRQHAAAQYGAPLPPPGQTLPYGAGQPYPPAARGPVRPRVLWIVLAWLVAVICTVVGVAGFAGGLFKTLGDAAPTHTFASGGSVSVRLDPADKPMLYASASGPTDVTCFALDSSGGKADLTRPKASQVVTANGRTWEGLFDIGVPAPGTYKVSCKGEDGKQVLFGVGKSLTASAGTLAGGVASLFLLPLGGFLFAVIVTIVVLVRRRGNRKRMAAASAYGAWPQGAPPAA